MILRNAVIKWKQKAIDNQNYEKKEMQNEEPKDWKEI